MFKNFFTYINSYVFSTKTLMTEPYKLRFTASALNLPPLRLWIIAIIVECLFSSSFCNFTSASFSSKRTSNWDFWTSREDACRNSQNVIIHSIINWKNIQTQWELSSLVMSSSKQSKNTILKLQACFRNTFFRCTWKFYSNWCTSKHCIPMGCTKPHVTIVLFK